MLALSPASTRTPMQRLSGIQMQDTPSVPAANTIGDYGFDPLNLGTDETFVPFREAEIKHGRLAMLAAVAWPLQEILHPIFVDVLRGSGLGAKDIMAATAGKSPSLLHGGLAQLEIAPTLMLAVYAASVLELKDIEARKGRVWASASTTRRSCRAISASTRLRSRAASRSPRRSSSWRRSWPTVGWRCWRCSATCSRRRSSRCRLCASRRTCSSP